MGMEVKLFSCGKNAIFPGAHKIGAAISGPRKAGKKFYGHENFSGIQNRAIPNVRFQGRGGCDLDWRF